MAAPRTCPTCWAVVPRRATACPACHTPLTPQAVGGRDPLRVATPGLPRIWPPTRTGLFLASAVAAGVAVSLALLFTIGAHLGPPAEAGTLAANTGIVYPIEGSPIRARHALNLFVPAGDAEDIQHAILNATGNIRANYAYPKGTRITAMIEKGGAAVVTVTIPVDVTRLVRKGWAVTGAEPETSDLKKGQLTINAPDDNEYVIRYDPRTDQAVFRFRISARDTTISPQNLNAMQVTSQTRSLG